MIFKLIYFNKLSTKLIYAYTTSIIYCRKYLSFNILNLLTYVYYTYTNINNSLAQQCQHKIDFYSNNKFNKSMF